MIHGNKKYDFSPLENINGEVTVTTGNIYALKSTLRTFFKGKLPDKITIKNVLQFQEVEPNLFTVTRIA